MGFLHRRTLNEKPQKMSALQPGYSYDSFEVSRPDDFVHPYVGKEYGSPFYRQGQTNQMVNPWTGAGYVDATEVISMGLDQVATNAYRFAVDDPDHFDFIFEKVMRRYGAAE